MSDVMTSGNDLVPNHEKKSCFWETDILMFKHINRNDKNEYTVIFWLNKYKI